jgi:hypothetical protein
MGRLKTLNIWTAKYSAKNLAKFLAGHGSPDIAATRNGSNIVQP